MTAHLSAVIFKPLFALVTQLLDAIYCGEQGKNCHMSNNFLVCKLFKNKMIIKVIRKYLKRSAEKRRIQVNKKNHGEMEIRF